MGFIGDLIRGRRAKKQADEDRTLFQGQLGEAQGRESAFYADEAAGKFDARVSQAQRDLASAGMKRTDTSGIQARQASELAALAQDPRALLGGIGGTTQRAQAASEKAAQADMKQGLAAQQGLANLEDAALAKNVAFDKTLASRKLAAAEQDIATSKENIEGARQRKRAAGDMQFEALVGAGEQIGGQVLGIAEQGAKVQKTPGAFSHATNPIDIVRAGKKIGEMTGGEYILNPQQAETIDEIQEAISKKKKPSTQELNKLYRAVRSVFSQRQFD
tara:strand:+ start:65 stop:889 length:825 start_codon:yes stop_codon:yes gene_type:complete